MKTSKKQSPLLFNSISELHAIAQMPKPMHPLISIVDYKKTKIDRSQLVNPFILNFYKVAYITKLKGKAKYGQSYYDFDEGGLVFISPKQVIANSADEAYKDGWSLYIHPDFIKNYPLGKKINDFGFFSYSINEALHLSESEKKKIFSVFKDIQEELKSTIDDFSQDVVVSYLELLLNYSNRFYKRQFITRKTVSHDLLAKLETFFTNYFKKETAQIKGLPTVQLLSEHLNVSSRYLSDMLRSLTGQNTQQYIHEKLIEKAKEKLSTTTLSIGEIAYELGFEHSQSFSKLFKSKTHISPLEFRQSFN